MELEIRREREMEETILETIKICHHRQEAPLPWAMEVGKCILSLGMSLPSPELGHVLVSYICFLNNHPSLWKFLQQALSSRLLSPIHVLSLLSARVIPNRRSQPEAYRLYLELLGRYAFSLDSIAEEACKQKIIKSVDAALQLSHTYRVQVQELGHVLVLFFFSIVVGLIDSTFNDWGLLMKTPDGPSGPFGSADNKDMDVDARGNYNVGRYEHRELLRKTNSLFAIEVLVKLTESRKAMVLLRIVYLNMPEIFNGLLQRLLFYKANKLASSNAESANQLLERLLANIQRVYGSEYQLNRHQIIRMLIDIKPCKHMSYCNSESGQSSRWVSLDIYMENAMDGKQLHIRPSVAILTEAIKTLQVLNRASWQETFLALWLSALRLVQRERDPVEGPIPHLESRLCILLTIVPLAIANILEDEARFSSSSVQGAGKSGGMESTLEHQVEGNGQTSRKHELILSLQVLGDFSGLLCPPSSVIGAANSAALVAASCISNSNNTKSGLVDANRTDPSINAGGNMRHLIVEACITRNLIDVSAYYWPGYVSTSVISLVSDLPPVQKSPWLTFMEGAPLDNSLVNLLLTTPAPSLAEIEKLYHIALDGSAEEKSAAAKILCGASLTRGWNIQEHVVRHVVKLLSPPIPSTHNGQRSHLVDYVPMLNAILFGVSTIDNVQMLSLHGVIPEVAASLMPLCEVFGSLVPTSTNISNSSDEPSIYMVFSNAFLFLLRLWKFYRPPLDQWLSGGGAFGGGLTLEYLLLLRNSRIASHNSAASNKINSDSVQLQSTSDKPVYIDFYPKLRAWYCQNKSCVASTLSGLCNGNPVHQVANKILNMIYSKMTKTGTSSGNSSTLSSNSLCGSTSSGGEDPQQRPMLPAWEVLEAIPFVLEAVLTACAHGKLSSRDLTTGLRDLIDFFPASIGAIISYFAAEITRGTWKPVPMNGTDWPSPAAVLPYIEAEMKEILSVAGVDFPSCSSAAGLSPVMLPLPMAALVSLTITFKLNKGLDHILAVVGPALENCASGCPWPSVPIIGSLWSQKVRRWHDYIVVSCARSVFRQNKAAVAQLLRSCFSSFLGSVNASTSLLTYQSSVCGLLGSTIGVPGVIGSLAAGFLYLRSCQTIQDIQYVNGLITSLVGEHARESTARWPSSKSSRLKSSQASLSLAATKAREAAMLGASLVCVSGGMNLVQELYMETIPTWLLSSRDAKHGGVSVVSRIVEGYAMACLLIFTGSYAWGVGARSPAWALSRRAHIVGAHMDFLAGVLEGNISLGCHPATWKAYVSCLVHLVVSFTPAWIQEVRVETLKKLASGLRGWHECELAISLLERGGVAAIGSVVELVSVIN